MEKTNMETIELGYLMGGGKALDFDMNQAAYQDAFLSFLDEAGFDSYGYPNPVLTGPYVPVPENDVFLIRPWSWTPDETANTAPNFVHKPTGTEVRWYKYPLRDGTCSRNITQAEWDEILKDCLASLPKASEEG